MLFHDRRDAGRYLAGRLAGFTADALVLALPRGGVPVGYEVARALGASLDVFVVRKIGVPSNPELAMGAIAPGGVCVLEDSVIARAGVTDAEVASAIEAEQREVDRRERLYRRDRPRPDVSGRTVIVVDDGLATGSTMLAAVRALRQAGPERIVAAAPAGASEACLRLSREADEVVCAAEPEPFYAVGMFYEDFSQTTDEEVRELLGAAVG